MIYVLLVFIFILFLFFYFVPFLMGYELARFGRPWMGQWSGWLITSLYVAWMLATWFEAGYAPVSFARWVSLQPVEVEVELYHLMTYLGLAVVSFYLVYSGADYGARTGFARVKTGEAKTDGPAL